MGGGTSSPTRQTIFWTVLPRSVDSVDSDDQPTVDVHVSATVAFRLSDSSAGETFTLSPFAALLNWPQFIKERVEFSVTLSTTGETYPAIIESTPQEDAWAALFDTDTPVKQATPGNYDARDQQFIRSYPRAEVASFVRATHVGAQVNHTDVLHQPVVREPVPVETFKSLLSPIRKPDFQVAQVRNAVRPTVQPANPATWAVSRNLRNNTIAAKNRTLSDFLQLTDYYRRGKDTSADPAPAPKIEVPTFDFHQMAAMALVQPTVGRALGLIIDFIVPAVPKEAFGEGEMQLNVGYGVPDVRREDVCFKTAYALSLLDFEIPAESSTVDIAGRYLRLGDTQTFFVENGLDLDSAALKVNDFSSQLNNESGSTDMPALRTAGFGVNRLDHAPKLGAVRLRDRRRFNAAFGVASDTPDSLVGASAVRTPSFVNHAEDLVRGFRFDVWDETRGRWFPLHDRSGKFILGRDTREFVISDVREEGFVSPVSLKARPVSTTQTPPDQFYVSETLMRWQGWSLSVPRVGAPITNNSTTLKRENGDTGPVVFPRPDGNAGAVVSQMNTPYDLPRLRFGRSYRFRARIVDSAGNSVAFERYQRPEELPGLVTDRVAFLRYDPVESPTLVLRQPPTAGEHVHELVVRSENASDQTTAATRRLVPPPPTSQWIAECHGLFDGSIDGGAAAAQYAALLVKREGKTWADSDDAVTVENRFGGTVQNEVFVPPTGDDNISVPYLPDPAARRALVLNIPGPTAAVWLPFGAGDLDNDLAAKLELVTGRDPVGPGDSSVNDRGDTLTVSLNKGDVRVIRISSALAQYSGEGTSAADAFGQYDWALAEAIRQNPNLSRDDIEFVYRQVLSGGGHRAMTPQQEVKLVHAVRTPLYAPNFVHRSEDSVAWGLIERAAGDTFALGVGKLVYSARSTGRLDIDCTWNDYVDRGPGGPDPRIAIPKSAHVFAREYDRNAVPAGLDPDIAFDDVVFADAARHEFGDTRHHLATYRPNATTAFLPYFRETATAAFTAVEGGANKINLSGASVISPAPVTVVGHDGFAYREGEDFVIRRETGEIERKFQNGIPRIRQTVTVSFIRGVIDAAGETFAVHVPATARPAAPKLHSVVPTFKWDRVDIAPGNGFASGRRSTRSGGGLRIWLDRPWFSSGEDERLAVLVAPGGLLPVAVNRPYVTVAGTDPVTESANTAHWPQASAFTGHDLEPTLAVVPETGAQVLALPLPVQFDPGRGQWFADLTVDPTIGAGEIGHFPFVKLALGRASSRSPSTRRSSPSRERRASRSRNSRRCSLVRSSRPTSFPWHRHVPASSRVAATRCRSTRTARATAGCNASSTTRRAPCRAAAGRPR